MSEQDSREIGSISFGIYSPEEILAMTSPNLAQFSSVISPTILMFSCEVETMAGFGIIISVGFSGSSSILCSLSSKCIYVRKEDVLDMISLLDNVSFVLCNT